MKLTVLVLSLLFTVSLWAEKEIYNIDPSHSSITFSVKHLMSKVKGSFSDFGGTIEADPQKPTEALVNATIKATSVNTANTKRDDHLRNEDFFDVKKYPDITFKSTKVTGKGKKFKMEGLLNMHGVEKPVTLDVEYMGMQADPWGNEKAGFSGSTKIKRKDFGMTYNKALDKGGFLLGDEVEIQLDIQAAKASKDKK